MESPSQEVPMLIYNNIHGYIAKFNITKDNFPDNYTNDELGTVVIIDCSSSMGSNTYRIINTILPIVFAKLGYSTEDITIISFNSRYKSIIHDSNLEQLKSLDIQPNGETYMNPAIGNLSMVFKWSKKTRYRILAISDGLLDDQLETLQSVSKLVETFKGMNYMINAQAIRLYTSEAEPDTRGLSSLIQLNTVNKANLIDIREYEDNESYVNKIVPLFKDDGLGFSVKLSAKEDCLMQEPWSPPCNSLTFPLGENLVWLNQINTDFNLSIPCNTLIPDIKIFIKECGVISSDNYSKLIEKKITFYLQKLKLLKIINTTESILEMNQIVEYFTNYETSLMINESNSIMGNSKIASRVEFIKKMANKRASYISNTMQNIKNDEMITQLNSKQQVEFLREIKTKDRVGRGLAKRAIIEGIDFDEEARQEVINMAEHLNELDSIDDSNHSISFYSTCTTMDGIKEVCNLAKDKESLDHFTASDIIKLLNIVGIACKGPIGDYPDPMTYRIEDIYPGTFVSISDILIASEISKEKRLTRIGTNQEINNVIAVFEDEKIHSFLLKYAPKLLDYTAGIGMRRILAQIPYTWEYTILAGVWKMIQLLFKDKSEIYIKTFVSLLLTYSIASGKHFEYIMELLENQKDDNNGLSIYIANNGVTNMTCPLLNLIVNNNTIQIKKILRALYQYEVYQFIRKEIRSKKDQDDFIEKTLVELLGINYALYGTQLPPMFEANPHPIFHSDYVINEDNLNNYVKRIYWSDFIALIPEFYTAALSVDPIKSFRDLPDMNNDDFIKEAFGINYELKYFRLFAIVQAFLYNNQSSRSNSKTQQMKIIDLDSFDRANIKLKALIVKKYQKEYLERYSKQTKQQIQLLSIDLVKKLLSTISLDEFILLLSKGITKGVITFRLYDPSSLGFVQLKDGLRNKNEIIPLREEKIRIFLLGVDKDNKIVWNNGNILREDIIAYKDVIEKSNTDIWNELVRKFSEQTLHSYRDDLPNRQGHSNDKISYWGKGYATLENMYKVYTDELIKEYKKEHTNCCGFGSRLEKYKLQKRLEKKAKYKSNVKESLITRKTKQSKSNQKHHFK